MKVQRRLCQSLPLDMILRQFHHLPTLTTDLSKIHLNNILQSSRSYKWTFSNRFSHQNSVYTLSPAFVLLTAFLISLFY
jgi:hypothetical protein